MKSSILGIVFLCSALAVAVPTAQLVKRNPCDGVNAQPVLYHQYSEDSCPAPNHMDSTGACPGLDAKKNKCASFCQVRTNFVYGQEIPFPNTYCHGPMTCSISTTDTVTYTYTGSINSKWFDALGLGITGGYNQAQAKAQARSFSKTLPQNQCGYFTQVPVRKDVCGTMTSNTLSVYTPPNGGIVPNPVWYCSGKSTTQANFCSSQPKYNADKSPDGDTIFVMTDCSTRQPLAPQFQDPVYNKPGVPLDRGVLASMIASWPSGGTTGSTTPPSTGPTEGDSCDVSYKFLWDQFEVRGKGWPNGQLGDAGAALEKQIKGCGKLTKWKFELTPKDTTYQWYASGRLPIGVKACVGRAVKTAGGSGASIGNCHGAG